MNYTQILTNTESTINQQKQEANRITFLRLTIALFALFAFYHLFGNNFSYPWLFLGIISTAIFLFLVNYHQKFLLKIRYNEAVCTVCKKEMAAEQGIIEQFDGGTEYLNPEHAFSFDLDIFGKNSIFQLLNRTFTKAGKDILATRLKFPITTKTDILLKQEATAELQSKVDFRVHILANGQLLEENSTKFNEFKEWLQEDKMNYVEQFKPLLWLIPTLNIGLLALVMSDFISGRVWLLALLVETGIAYFTRRKVSQMYLKIDRYLPKLQQYTELFKRIENENFEAFLLKKWQGNLKNDAFLASKQIEKLIAIGQYYDLRNTLFGPVLNALFLWDYQCAYQLERWKQQNSRSILQSFEILHELEGFIGIACFAYANPSYQLPLPSDTQVLSAKSVGHPLLKSESRVCNDFEIQAKEQIFIATGANMAGKSTFLRAIGVNFVLAMMGSPVCAEQFIFRPIQLFTCMRITDSIGEGESYFHAELVRLQGIVKRLDEGRALFVILDELLKGTNSKDKLLGSEMYLKKMLQYPNVWGLIATHDLDLTKMVKSYPEQIKNICFEITIEDNQMNFDYKLRKGVTQNMNALFLMKQMGITPQYSEKESAKI